MKDRQAVDYRRELAVAKKCRDWLWSHGFITEQESMKIFDRLEKYKYEHNISISETQLHSVVITYKDNLTDDHIQEWSKNLKTSVLNVKKQEYKKNKED